MSNSTLNQIQLDAIESADAYLNNAVLPLYSDVCKQRNDFKAQRDELLAALIAITDESVCLKSAIVEQARAAIAKARGTD